MINNINLIKHPLIQHKLTYLRDKKTSSKDFREYANEISKLMAYEVLTDLKVKDVIVQTPIAKAEGKLISQKINLFPILRAGEGMLSGFLETIPTAKVGHIGLYRDKETLTPIKYLFKSPINAKNEENLNIILDPVIATGNSIIEALEILKEAEFYEVRVAAIIISKVAIDKIVKKFPNVKLFVAAIDEKLNNQGYIIPGLGDAGDRLYGTK